MLIKYVDDLVCAIDINTIHVIYVHNTYIIENTTVITKNKYSLIMLSSASTIQHVPPLNLYQNALLILFVSICTQFKNAC